MPAFDLQLLGIIAMYCFSECVLLPEHFCKLCLICNIIIEIGHCCLLSRLLYQQSSHYVHYALHSRWDYIVKKESFCSICPSIQFYLKNLHWKTENDGLYEELLFCVPAFLVVKCKQKEHALWFLLVGCLMHVCVHGWEEAWRRQPPLITWLTR